MERLFLSFRKYRRRFISITGSNIKDMEKLDEDDPKIRENNLLELFLSFIT